jgi:hypothetical protein
MIKGYQQFLESQDQHDFISNDNALEIWKNVYGTDFRSEHPEIFRILKQRAKMDKRELDRIWQEKYDEKFQDVHPKVWAQLK